MILDAIKAVVATVIFLIALGQPLCGQQDPSDVNQSSYTSLVEKAYGLDQDLINGVQYFDRYLGCKGDSYIGSIVFEDGELTIKERVYHNLKIRYDIFSQSVEVEYDILFGRGKRLITIADHVEAFQIQEYSFEKLNIEEPSEKFYQVIQTDFFSCYVHWEKQLIPLQNDRNFTKEFSKPKSTCLLDVNGAIREFKSRKDFVELFPDHQKKKIKRLLKKNLVRIQSASPGDMVLNMNEVAKLLKTGGVQ